MGKEYTKEQYEFAVFLSLSREERLEQFGYYTQRDFALAYKLPHEKILSEWKARGKFKKMYERMIKDGFNDILADAKNALVRRGVEDGDVSALKEIFKIAEISKEKLEIISSEKIQDTLAKVVEVIQRHVKDPKILNAIASELEDLEEEL
jgi:hypothetical protein